MEIVVTKLKELIVDLGKITMEDKPKFDRVAERAKGIATNQFGQNETYSANILILQSKVSTAFLGLSDRHIQELTSLIEVMLDDVELALARKSAALNLKDKTEAPQIHEARHIPSSDNLKVFVVHGHNEAMKLATARTLEKLGFLPIILHEKANSGDTIIEKFTKHSDVGFAVILLSADDYGYSKTDKPVNAKLRARQNVIFELGFFTAKLGRKRVVAIFEQIDHFEKPSDIDGVIYIPYNSKDSRWQFDLSRELMEVGYSIDSNVLLK